MRFTKHARGLTLNMRTIMKFYRPSIVPGGGADQVWGGSSWLSVMTSPSNPIGARMCDTLHN